MAEAADLEPGRVGVRGFQQRLDRSPHRAWLRLLALPETLKTCEPKALRYRFLHIPARLTTSGRRRHLRLPETWPWTQAAVAAFTAVMAIPLLT